MPAAPAALSHGSLKTPPAAAAVTPSAVIKTLEDFAAAVADIDDVSDLLLYSAAEMAELLEENASPLKDGSKLPGQKQREMLMAQHAALLAASASASAGAARRAKQPSGGNASCIPIVVSCPEHGTMDPDNGEQRLAQGADPQQVFNQEVMTQLMRLCDAGLIKIAFDRAGTSTASPEDTDMFEAASHIWSLSLYFLYGSP